ncbi:MAG: decarboxylating NADP(+)-dependent phosphogluconate dehydrogenase [Gammaproteobacteria bacterium]|nr:MAG: decarboxylating NADP(+)-dependent phosphogluconate dehydrogenase [Gammaproteobacteria bacterium]
MKAEIGVIGLGVMGSNIALNIADHGYRVAVFNHRVERVHRFLADATDKQRFTGCESYAALAQTLATPRIVLMMVTAGSVVDLVIEQIRPHLQPGDVLIDGGNSFYEDTERRLVGLREHGIHYVGMGISGGEEGARHGPSLMPGGDPEAWPLIREIFQAIAARAEDGEPCCRWVGNGGAGHYVKMVHNGIEYGDMQLIAEAWDLMYRGLGLTMDRLAEIFERWNDGVLSSYLIEITAEILRVRDPDGSPRVLNILDAAGQKGTGRWTVIEALQLGIPLTLIGEAVFARALSARRDERLLAAERLADDDPLPAFEGDTDSAVAAIHDALYAAKIISYAQGFMQMREASRAHDWDLAFGDIALLWRAGCIIRSRFLNDIKAAYDRNPQLRSLLLDDFFARALQQADAGWRKTLGMAIRQRIPLPATGSALAFYDGYRSKRLPANLLQAQRDYFGAHTYRRIDQPEHRFHTHWSGDGHEEALDD